LIALPIAHHRQFVADFKLRAKGQASLGIYPHNKIFPLAGDDDKIRAGDTCPVPETVCMIAPVSTAP